MKTDLDLLIEFLEQERAFLEKIVGEYLEEHDYLYAYYQENGLGQIRSTLDRLYAMKTPFYNEIVMLERMRTMINRPQDNDRLQEFLSDYYKKKIEKQELKIRQLRENKPEPFYDAQIIDDALFDLVEGKLKGFQLCFREDESGGICIEFKLLDVFITIALPVDMHLNEFDPEDDGNWRHIGTFAALGFEPDESGRLIYKYPVVKFKDAIEIKILLARLLYDVFYYNAKYDSARLIYL